MFVHIAPEETATIRSIPRELLFPAPGRPEGHLVLGYDDQGRCPMLRDDRCSIYDARPQTCRTYDCRILAAAGVLPADPRHADIARRVQAWQFQHPTEQSFRKSAQVRQAFVFLQTNRSLFPPGSLPEHPEQLAAMAIRIHRMFLTDEENSSEPASVLAARIMQSLNAE